jgi:glutathione S-transferase
MHRSGNCYKVSLLLRRLQRPYRWHEVDVLGGANRSEEFLALNPSGKVPVLRWDDGKVLSESGAILVYLAEGSALWPADAWERAQTLRWMFFEQHSHAPFIAQARFISQFLPADHPRRAELPQLQQGGARALGLMEQHLAGHHWFSGRRDGVADIALYAYTHAAAEGGFQLADYPQIQAWLKRMAALPEHHTMAEAARSLQLSELNA